MITLTSKLGNFIFPKETLLSHAKLVRDNIVGQWFNPKPGTPRLNNANDIDNFMRNHSSRLLTFVQFEVTPNIKEKEW